MPLGVGAGLAIAGGVQGLLNTGMQYQQYNYAKSLQKKMFRREDNSIQRRVADLRKAGLSPVLAAGVGADPGPTVSTQAPQNDSVDKAISMLSMQQNIAQSQAQIELANAQKAKTTAEAEYAQHEVDYYKGKPGVKGTVKGATNWAKTIQDVMSLWKQHVAPNLPSLPKGEKKSPAQIEAERKAFIKKMREAYERDKKSKRPSYMPPVPDFSK